nr:uncharacterized protein LOC123285309 isoform X1 [Equus asinus]
MKWKSFLDFTSPDGSFTCSTLCRLSLQDIIPGIMHWKRFQPLVFSSLPETSKVETTQSCDPFAVALLPAHVPATLDALPEEDRLEAAERELCEQNIEITLTPEMIEAEFPLLDSKDTKKENLSQKLTESSLTEAHTTRAWLDRDRAKRTHQCLISPMKAAVHLVFGKYLFPWIQRIISSLSAMINLRFSAALVVASAPWRPTQGTPAAKCPRN